MFDCRILTLAVVLVAWAGVAYSQTKSQPENKSGTLSAQQSNAKPAPPAQFSSQQQVTKGVADRIETATKEYDARHSAPPPDNSGWWFNLFLVIFTGGLFVVGAGQCYLIFWTLKATQEAAHAAIQSARTAERGMLTLEIPYLYPFVREHGFITAISPYAKVLAVSDFEFGNDFIKYYFKNFGRTPAEITEVQAVLIPSMGMPSARQWGDKNINPLPGHVVAADGGESQDFSYSFFKGTLEGASPTPIRLETTVFWFIGYVRYKDVFENEYVRGFCLGYSPMTNSFYPCGGEGYNYRKKTKSAGETESAK
jgi:hypothetical protein